MPEMLPFATASVLGQCYAVPLQRVLEHLDIVQQGGLPASYLVGEGCLGEAGIEPVPAQCRRSHAAGALELGEACGVDA